MTSIHVLANADYEKPVSAFSRVIDGKPIWSAGIGYKLKRKIRGFIFRHSSLEKAELYSYTINKQFCDKAVKTSIETRNACKKLLRQAIEYDPQRLEREQEKLRIQIMIEENRIRELNNPFSHAKMEWIKKQLRDSVSHQIHLMDLHYAIEKRPNAVPHLKRSSGVSLPFRSYDELFNLCQGRFFIREIEFKDDMQLLGGGREKGRYRDWETN